MNNFKWRSVQPSQQDQKQQNYVQQKPASTTITRLTRLSVLLTLAIIWIAELAYFPIALSVIFACMWINLLWNYKNSILPFHIQKRLSNQTKNRIQQGIKVILTLFALMVIWLNYGTFVGVEAGTAALATFLYGKALETKQSRDYIVLFNFALFVSASLFLHSQSVLMAMMVLCSLLGSLVGLYQLQTGHYVQSGQTQASLKTDTVHVLKVMGLAVPFFVLLFMFFPRLPPLWQIPVNSQQGVTGISDRMSPGDIAELSQSSALAFRVMGDLKKLPPRQNLYWRAMVLDQYDGQTWTSHPSNQSVFNITPETTSTIKQTFNYQYLAADNQTHWVMGLEASIPSQRGFQVNLDGAIIPTRAVQRTQPIQLQWVGKQLPVESDASSDTFLNQRNTRFQQHYDPKSQQLAMHLWNTAQHQPKQYVQHVLAWYKQNHFSYTLTPGTLAQNRVDGFLFQSRQGFCEHYASSFTMLMRYVGIPARVVVGYQGGQFAPDGQSWEIRQMDAHAWTEVQLDGKWQRIDPTFIIAPNRIDQGMQDFMQNDQSVFGENSTSIWKYQQFNALKTLRVWSDYASYQWQSKVVGYDAEKQTSWMAKLGLTSSYSFALVLMLGLLGLGGLYFIVVQIRQYLAISAVDRILYRFSKHLDEPFYKQTSETFEQWMFRLSEYADIQTSFLEANQIYQKIVYMKQEDKMLLKQLDVLLKQCASELKNNKKACHVL